MSKKGKIQLAKEFRKVPTKSERAMWKALRNRQFLNLKIRRQHLIDGFILDFYCHELKLAIEIDGLIHQDEEQIEYDAERQKIIEQDNIKFIRIKSKEVEFDLANILEKLKYKIKQLNP